MRRRLRCVLRLHKWRIVPIQDAMASRSCELCGEVEAHGLGEQGGPAPQLLPEERDWLRYLAGSGTVADLSCRRGCSEAEMYRSLAGVYVRLGATNRTQALERAKRLGLLDGEGS